MYYIHISFDKETDQIYYINVVESDGTEKEPKSVSLVEIKVVKSLFRVGKSGSYFANKGNKSYESKQLSDSNITEITRTLAQAILDYGIKDGCTYQEK